MFEPEPIDTREHIGLAEDEDEQKQKEEFKIDDDEKANWALRKIRHKKQKIKEKEELAQKEIDKIQKEIDEIKDWLNEEKSKLQNDIENFKTMLFEYAASIKEEDPDFKTKKLPFGKLQFRKQRPKWQYNDEKLFDSIKEAGYKGTSIIQTKEKLYKSELKAAISSSECPLELTDGKVVDTQTGQVIEGVEVQERGEKFKVKVKEDK